MPDLWIISDEIVLTLKYEGLYFHIGEYSNAEFGQKSEFVATTGSVRIMQTATCESSFE
jgi:hypothetical protein